MSTYDDAIFHTTSRVGNTEHVAAGDLSLRDLFAVALVHGIASSGGLPKAVAGGEKAVRTLSRIVYLVADEMLAARDAPLAARE